MNVWKKFWNHWSQLVLHSICEFSKSELKFLGHVVNWHGVQALLDNLELWCIKLWFSRGGWNSVGSSEIVFILGCSEEVSAIRIAYLIARCNGRSNSSLHINSCCNNVTVGVLLLIRSGYLFECYITRNRGWCDISICRNCGVSTKRFKEGDSVFGM